MSYDMKISMWRFVELNSYMELAVPRQPYPWKHEAERLKLIEHMTRLCIREMNNTDVWDPDHYIQPLVFNTLSHMLYEELVPLHTATHNSLKEFSPKAIHEMDRLAAERDSAERLTGWKCYRCGGRNLACFCPEVYGPILEEFDDIPK